MSIGFCKRTEQQKAEALQQKAYAKLRAFNCPPEIAAQMVQTREIRLYRHKGKKKLMLLPKQDS